jgi:hypothetical protein
VVHGASVVELLTACTPTTTFFPLTLIRVSYSILGLESSLCGGAPSAYLACTNSTSFPGHRR